LKERWKDIETWEGLYMISDYGRVRSLPREVHYPSGQILKVKDRILKHGTNGCGYPDITLTKRPHRKERHTIHRLVARHFLDNPRGLNEVNHKDGVKTNPHYTNLEWCTQSENRQHAYDTGLQVARVGEELRWTKLTDEAVREIRRRAINGERAWDMHKEYGVTYQNLRFIIQGKTWKHVL
jgi:hypothetical protein